MEWPGSIDGLTQEQEKLAASEPPLWTPPRRYAIGASFVCFPRGKSGDGARGDPGWAGAALISRDLRIVTALASGHAGAPYAAGLLALREGPLLEAAVRALPAPPDVLLVNATGRDHPRRAGLALHLGALLGLPTVGVTHRPLLASGDWPEPVRGARAPLEVEGNQVGWWLCTRDGTRPLAVHAAWRTDLETAAEIVLAASTARARTPTPLRHARRIARRARTAAEREGLASHTR